MRHIRTIATEAKQELMNAFRREMTLQLVAVSRHKSSGEAKRRLRQKKSTPKPPTIEKDSKLKDLL